MGRVSLLSLILFYTDVLGILTLRSPFTAEIYAKRERERAKAAKSS